MIQVIIRYYSAQGKPLHKLSVEEETDISEIFKVCEQVFKVPIRSQIIKFKRDGFSLRLVPGWPLSFYEIVSGSILVLESTEQNLDLKLEEIGGLSSDKNRYLMQILQNQERGITTISEEPEERENGTEEIKIQRGSGILSPTKNSLLQKKKNINKELITSIKKEDNLQSFLTTNSLGENDLINLSSTLGPDGWSAVHHAVNGVKGTIIKQFITLGCSFNIEAKDGLTPLILCVRKNHFELLKLLVNTEGVDISHCSSQGTVLQAAIQSNNNRMISFLLEKGANPLQKTHTGQVVIDFCDDTSMKQEILNKFKEIKTLKSAQKKPPIVKGKLYKTGLFFRNLKRRYLVINTNKRTLIRYASELDVPDKPKEIIPLKDIIKVGPLTKRGIFFQSGFYYFEVLYGSRILFATKSKARTDKWIHYIQQAIAFSKNYEEAIRQKLLDNKVAEMIEENPAEEIDLDKVKLEGECGQMQSKSKDKNKKLRTFKYTVNLSSFEVMKFIGRGAFGRVYKCKLKMTGKQYAMKVLNKELLYRRKQIKYAVSEASILENANHPFILALHFSFQTPNNLYMVIDYCPGGDLSLILAQMNTFTESQARFYIAELLLSIESLHKMGVLYRDLKPENILLDKKGHIKLADFGLSRENLQKGDIAKSFCGSPIYLSPEMVQQKGATQASDIYGIGLVLYEMLFGQPPYYTEELPKLYQKIKKANLTFPDNISPEAKDLLTKLLKKEPKDRLGVENKSEIKNHPWFKEIDWDDVFAKKLEPPFVDEYEDIDHSRRRLRINDKDYTKDNWKFMRVDGFEFVRESEIDGNIVPLSNQSFMSDISSSRYTVKG